jgi:hypothetical protein
MDTSYKIKKSWFGFWQKYKLTTQLKLASKLFLWFIIIWLIGSLLTIFSQWAYTDNFQGSLLQPKYLEYFWPVIIELVSGYDIDDSILKLNPVSKILSIVMLISGIIIFAIFTGQIVSMFIQVLQRIHHLPEKPGHFKFNRPLIIFGINPKLHRIIMELRKSLLAKGREIVIVDKNADQVTMTDKELYKDVWYVKGNRADRAVIAGVVGKVETSAIILTSESACDRMDRYADSRSIETAMAVEGYQEKIHTVMELVDDRNIPHLIHTRINEWISIFDYGIKLVSQAALQKSMGSVYHYLLGDGSRKHKSTQIHFTQAGLPKELAGLTYENIRDRLLSKPDLDITLIGFAKYVDAEDAETCGLNLVHSPYINQLNPVNRFCKSCGEYIEENDGLGRIRKKCPECFEKESPKNSKTLNSRFFPKDTRLSRKDKLIYLSPEPVDFDKLFHSKLGRRR